MKKIQFFTLLAILFTALDAQACDPCAAHRWTEGGEWANGQVDESPHPQATTKGVIRCRSAADTESNIQATCSNGYDGSFPLGNRTCPDITNPSNTTYIQEPTAGSNVIWIQFDVRNHVGTFEFQIINGSTPIAWELFYSNNPSNDGIGGDCSDLTFLECGLDFSSWADFPYEVPIFNQPSNFYLAVYSRDPAQTLSSVNFKARNGCGNSNYCALFPEDVTSTCNPNDTYTVTYPTYGVNGSFDIVDNTGNALSLTPSSINFPGGTTTDSSLLFATIEAVYPIDVDYSISLVGQGESCFARDTVTGAAPVCCTLDISCQGDINLPCASPTGTAVNWHEPLAFSSNCYDCPTDTSIPGFMDLGTHNGHRYYCSVSPNHDVTWEEADSVASSLGGYIVTINDQAENDLLDSWIEDSNNWTPEWNIWIGLYYDSVEGTHKWTSGEPASYTNWASGEPGSNQYTKFYGGDGKWSTSDGSASLEWVLEIPCGPAVYQTSGPENGSTLAGETRDTVTYVVTDDFGHSETCSFEVSVESCTPFYCDNYSLYSDYEWIAGVSLYSLDHDSEASNYSDFCAFSTDLQAGGDYHLGITPDYAFGMYNEYYYVFIDLDQDGVFDETKELLLAGYGAGEVTGNLQIPTTALKGNTLMRVVMSYTELSSACGWFTYGEVEDYTIKISNDENTRRSEILPSLKQLTSGWGIIVEPKREKSSKVEGLYPNPAQDFVYLHLETAKVGEANLELLNNLGLSIFSQQITTKEGLNTLKIDLPETPPGIYFMSIKYPSGKQKTLSLLVN